MQIPLQSLTTAAGTDFVSESGKKNFLEKCSALNLGLFFLNEFT